MTDQFTGHEIARHEITDLRTVFREQLCAGHFFADNYSQDLFSQAMWSASAASVVRQTVMRTDN